MIKSELSITIDAPPEEVFACVSDVEYAMKYVPSLVDVKNVTGHGKGQTHQGVYKMMGVKLEMDVTVTEYVPNERFVMEFDGGSSGSASFTLKPVNDGCQLDVTNEYSIPIPLVGKVAEILLKKRNEREFQTCLANLKELVETDAGVAVD